MSTNESKHTPGPWTALLECEVVQGPEGDLIAETHKNQSTVPGSQLEANAHLIAAAPDMLEALEAAKEHLEWTTPEGKAAFKLIYQALAKAKGGQS